MDYKKEIIKLMDKVHNPWVWEQVYKLIINML